MPTLGQTSWLPTFLVYFIFVCARSGRVSVAARVSVEDEVTSEQIRGQGGNADPVVASDNKLSKSGWPFFDGVEGDCSVCKFGGGRPGSAAMNALKKETDMAVGCVSKDQTEDIPLCPLKGSSTSSDQAGGHAGTIAALTGGRIAKLTKAFDDIATDGSSEHHIEYARVEYQVYMEMWCMQRLKDLSDPNFDPNVLEEHPLERFALGKEPWAPQFHGVCKLPGLNGNDEPDESARPRLFIVQENMLDGFVKPCQLDLKLGFETVEPWSRVGSDSGIGFKKVYKQLAHKISDALSPSAEFGARLAGYKIFDPFVNVFEKMASKWADPMSPLPSVFDKFFDESGHVGDSETFEAFRQRLLHMAAWWAETGEAGLRSVALSALFAYECEPQIGGEISISDIKVEGALPAMDSAADGGKADPYIMVKSFPRDKLFPNVDFGGDVTHEITTTEDNHLLGTRFSRYVSGHGAGEGEVGNRSNDPFATSTIMKELTPKWDGEQFNILYGPSSQELVFDMWDQDAGAHEFIGRVVVTSTEVPRSSGRLCLRIRSCGECKKQGTKPELCFTVAHERREYVKPTPPRLKLIDYAHLYNAEAVSSDWQPDGVHEGLLSAIRELDRKFVASWGGKFEGGDRMKCPDNTARHHKVTLTLPTCKQYGAERHMKYVAFRPLATTDDLGECRVCDSLVPRNKSFGFSGNPYKIFRLE